MTGQRLAELALSDRTIPRKVARGRATRDLDATIERDKGDVQAYLLAANLAHEDGRQLEAADWVKRAKTANKNVGHPVLLMQARVELAMGIDAQAEQSAELALPPAAGSV